MVTTVAAATVLGCSTSNSDSNSNSAGSTAESEVATSSDAVDASSGEPSKTLPTA